MARLKPRQRRYQPREDLLGLFALVGRYRVMSTPHAHALYFAAPSSATHPTLRATQLRIARLQEEGFLAGFSLPATPPVRFSFLTRAAFDRFPALHGTCGDLARKRPPPDIAIHAWTRAALAASAQAAGFTVGRDVHALTALRRFLIDGQLATIRAAKPGPERDEATRVLAQLRGLPLLQPWVVSICEGCAAEMPVNVSPPPFCEECGSTFKQVLVSNPHSCARCGLQIERTGPHVVAGKPCSGTPRQVDYLPFDLAWRKDDSTYSVQILFADNPYRSLPAQLEELPLRVIGQPRVPIVLRAPDDGTVFDKLTMSYALKGPRLRAIFRQFNEDVARPDAFPFWTTSVVLSDAIYPDAHFRVLHHKETT